MKKIFLLIILLSLLLACKEKTNELATDQAESEKDSLSQTREEVDFSNSQMVINPETGDTIYVDFGIKYEEGIEHKKYEKYFIISTYTSYTKDSKLQVELSKWKELEVDAYLEDVKIGQASKYFISIGKFADQEQAMEKLEAFKKKYPTARIHIQSITQ